MAICTSNAQSELTFVFLNKKTDKKELPKEEVDKLMEGHMANINRLAQENKLVAAGPFDGGGGLFVFKSNSVDQVREWIGTDPAVKAERWNVEILPYEPLVGSICKVSEPYEMVKYNFIRFSKVDNMLEKNDPSLLKLHKSYWVEYSKTNSLITFATFGDQAGEILVTAQQVDENVVLSDPAVRSNQLKFESKVLWIAKGSFCEK
jgi:uncharacterized protein YciI